MDCFLNEQLRHLPVPGQKGGEVWDQVENPQHVLELLYPLLRRLCRASRKEPQLESHVERVVSIYTLYAIIDRLARRCDEAYLSEDYLANGTAFGRYMGSPVLRISNVKTYERATQLSNYFGLKPFKPYTKKELDEYQANRLFNFSNAGRRGALVKQVTKKGHLTNLGLRNSVEFGYFRSLLKDENI